MSKRINNRTKIVIELNTIDNLDLMNRFIASSIEKANNRTMSDLNLNLKTASKNNTFNRFLYFIGPSWPIELSRYINNEIKDANVKYLYSDKYLTP